jgi:hypothetical protein
VKGEGTEGVEQPSENYVNSSTYGIETSYPNGSDIGKGSDESEPFPSHVERRG